MIIYLDESKKLGDGKIVFGGFISYHKHSFLQKLGKRKKEKYGFSENLEIKGKNDTGKNFYIRMINDIDFNFLHNAIIGISIDGYYSDSFENYYQVLRLLLNRIRPTIESYNQKIIIYADKINLGKNSVVQKELDSRLIQDFSICKSVNIIFKSSKDNIGIQIADLIVYQLRLSSINDEIVNEFLYKNSLNIDLNQKFII